MTFAHNRRAGRRPARLARFRFGAGDGALCLTLAAATAAAFSGAVPAQAVASGGATGSYPAVVHIATATRACSGVLVDRSWILTAATCVASPGQTTADVPPEATTVTFGRGSGSERQVTATEVVPRADRNVALVRLSTPVTDVTPVAVTASPAAQGDVLRVVGYGRTTDGWITGRLASGQFTAGTVTPTTISLTGIGGATLCKGDAGGPALREADGRTEVVALDTASFQHGCDAETETRTGATGVRIDDLGPWISDYAASCKTSPAPGFTPMWDGNAQSPSWSIAGSGPASATDCELSIAGGSDTTMWRRTEHLPNAYTMRMQYRGAAGSDSGVLLGFNDPTPDASNAWTRGVEVQVLPGNANSTGSLWGLHDATADPQRRPGDWNTLEITVDGRTIHVWVNGTKVNEYTMTDPNRLLSSGYVGLQGGSASSPVRFRNVQIRVNQAPAKFGPIVGYQNRCVDLDGSKSVNTTQLHLATCKERQWNQQFTVAPDSSLQVTGRCIDANGVAVNSTDQDVQLWACNQTPLEKWEYRADRSLYSGAKSHCLDQALDGPKPLYGHECNGMANQKWDLPTMTARFGLVAGYNNMCLDARSYKTDNGTPLDLVSCHENQHNQMYTLTADGTVQVMGKCLDDNGPVGDEHGSGLHYAQLWDCNGTSAQKFEHRADGSIYSPRTDKCLDAPVSGGTTRLYFQSCWGGNNQKFAVAALGSGVTGADALKPVAVPAAAGPVADPSPVTDGTSTVEDYSYPGSDKIFADTGVRLYKGDGRILFADCGTRQGLVVVESRATSAAKPFCFKVLGGSGYVTMEIPNAYFVDGDGTNVLKATVRLDGRTQPEAPVTVQPDGHTPIGESSGDFTPGALVELRVA